MLVAGLVTYSASTGIAFRDLVGPAAGAFNRALYV